MKEEVFISYAWITKATGEKKHQDIVVSIEKALKKDFKVVIDKKDLNYKDNIKEFEKRLGKGNKIILVISDRFLKSKHCMFEILKIKQKGNMVERIFPVVLSDADIYNSQGVLKYVKHWEVEIDKLSKAIGKLKSPADLNPLNLEISNYTEFRKIIADITEILGGMNTLSPDVHKKTNFKELINALHGNKPRPDNKLEKVFGNKVLETRKLFEKAIEIVGTETKSESKNAEDILEKIKFFYHQCKNQTFQIAVMAMVKSGKSTFLNALLGDEFLPMSNVPETSVPIKINHIESGKGILLNGRSKIEGASKIKKHLESVNKDKREQGFKYEVEYQLQASFKILEEKEMTDIKFEVIDTPGFGEAMTQITVGKSIDESNKEMIDKISAIIYLLDYTKLKTKGEDEVLNMLADLRSDILEKIQDRIFFVINKIDEEDRNSLPPNDAIDYVFKMVKEKAPNVLRQHFFNLSANQALLSRLILTDNATKDAKQDFGKIAFGFNANKKDETEYKEMAKEILISSQIVEIENKIINYIFENRSKIFIESLQDRLKQLLFEFKNKYVTTAIGVLSRTVQEIEELEQKIELAKKKQESIQDEADKFEREIKEWIEGEFKGFEKTITDHIDSAFNFEKAEEKRSSFNRIIPNWVRKIQNFLVNAEAESSNATREDIEKLIEVLNKLIIVELITSFGEFRKQLEQKIINKQALLFENLKLTINALAQEFESTLKKALLINYDIVELRLEGVNADMVLSNANAFLTRFIKSNYRLESVEKAHTVYNPGSWCAKGRYETRYTIEQEWVVANNINKNGIELHWQKEIEIMNTNAKKITNHLIENSIKTQIKNARNSFNSYVGDYMTTIQEQKIKLSSGTRDEINERLKTLERLDEDITSIVTKL